MVLLSATFVLSIGSVWAQYKRAEQCDTINMGGTNNAQASIAQVPLAECQAVDTCENAQYAIVTQNNKKGIYDLKKGLNITPIAYNDLSYYECEVTEWGTPLTHFLATRGTELGRIEVNSNNNTTFEVWGDNPELVASLTYCTTINNQLTKQCRKFLSNGLKTLHGLRGQLAVVDAQTGQLKAWIAMQNENGKLTDAKLFKKACSFSAALPITALTAAIKCGHSLSDSINVGYGIYCVNDTLTIRDSNWRSGGYDNSLNIHDALTHHSKVAMFRLIEKAYGSSEAIKIWQNALLNESNAMQLALFVNTLCSSTDLREPALIGDSLKFVGVNRYKANAATIKTFLTDMNEADALQAKYAPHGVQLSGIYSSVARSLMNDREFSFAGTFPADKPRYVIGAFIDTPQDDKPRYNGHLAQSVINPLIKWLMKQQTPL